MTLFRTFDKSKPSYAANIWWPMLLRIQRTTAGFGASRYELTRGPMRALFTAAVITRLRMMERNEVSTNQFCCNNCLSFCCSLGYDGRRPVSTIENTEAGTEQT